MSLSLAARITNLRRARKETQTEFAEALGVSQGTVARWEGGSSPKRDALMSLASLAQTSVDHFIGLRNPVPDESGDIQVVGFVGAGAAVYPYEGDAAPGDGFDTVERPSFVKGAAVAVEVKGDSLVPVAEDGWRLIYCGEQTIVEHEVLNRLCIVKLIDGRMLVKRLIRGSESMRYHLLSTNAPMIENVEVEWAARVKAIIPS